MSNHPDAEPGGESKLASGSETAAEEFERAWQNCTPPCIAAYLGKTRGDERQALLEMLVRLDIEQRARIGARHVRDDYRREFPELAPSDTLLTTRIASPSTATASVLAVPGYGIIEELGRGGMGIVYKAQQAGLNRVVALKTIRGGAGPEELARFRLEAEAVARLKHPHIVQIHEIGEVNGQPYLSLEYVDGGTLAGKLAHTPQPPTAAAALVETLARAMQVAHDHHIVHRDLKPANVLLTIDGMPKISDFGLAKEMDSETGQTRSGAILGTPSYMAPEQAQGRLKDIGPLTDVYALGAILYEMLTGRPPFKGATPLETIEQVCSEEPVPPRRLQPKIPRDLETICLKCLQKEPRDRYASAARLADDLCRFLKGEPILARRVGLGERALKWVRRHPTGTALMAMALLLLIASMLGTVAYRNQQEITSHTRAQGLVDSLASADTADVPQIIDGLAPYRRWADPILYRRLAETPPDSKEHLHVRMALVPVSDNQVDFLFERLLVAKAEELLTIRTALQQPHDGVVPRLWAVLEDGNATLERRVRAACALASYDRHSERWARVRREVAAGLASESGLALGKGREALRPVRHWLIAPLMERFIEEKLDDGARSLAFSVLADYASDQPDILAELDQNCDDLQHGVLLPGLLAHRERVTKVMRQELGRPLPPTAKEEERDRLARRQARAAVALLQLGDSEYVWPLLRHSSDPSRRTYLLHDLGRRGTDAEVILRRVIVENDVGARRALILCLGELTGKQLSAAQQQQLLPVLLRWYRDDPDPGIHAAVDWLLRHGRQGAGPRKLDWQQGKVLDRLDRELAALPPGTRHWYVSRGQLLTMTIVPSPAEFSVGTPFVDSKDKNLNEYPHRVKIPRSFAIAAKEVTVGQFRRFLEDTPKVKARFEFQEARSPEDDGPIIGVTWFQAAQFCNWLSKQEGIPPTQWCYPDVAELDYGMVLPKDYLQRQGYRLPTEAEWEYACRSGSATSRFYGTAEEMLKEYAWYSKTSNTRAFPVGQLKPNDLGLFDIYGNAMEWCQDEGDNYRETTEVRVDGEAEGLEVTRAQPRVLRGGSFFYLGRSVRSAFRDYYRPTGGIMYAGVRPARTLP